MIIVLSHAADATASFICKRLTDDRLQFVRIDTDLLVESAQFTMSKHGMKLNLSGTAFSPEQVKGVLFRRPRPIRIDSSDAAEAQHTSLEWAEALHGFLACVPRDRWINHPSLAVPASHKMEQLARASRLGLRIPDTLITQDEEAARHFIANHETTITKPLSGGFIERESGGDSLIYTTRITPDHINHLSLVRRCPTLFQEEIDKAYDVRATIVDNRISAVTLRKRGTDGGQITDIRRDNWEGVEYQKIKLPEIVATQVRGMVLSYGLRFAAVDFAISKTGQWIFFEANTGGQWAWIDMQAGTDIAGDLAWALNRQPNS